MGLFTREKKHNNTLTNFKLHFEEVPPKPTKTKNKRSKRNDNKKAILDNSPDTKRSDIVGYLFQRRRGNNISNVPDIRRPNVKQQPVATKKKLIKSFSKFSWLGIIGIGLALVVGSIIYSSAVVFLQTNDLLARLALVPQAAAAVSLVAIAFWKILK